MSDDHIPVANRNDLVKDPKTGSILNVDNAGLEAYKKRKRRMREDARRIEKLEGELSEIKAMLKTLMDK